MTNGSPRAGSREHSCRQVLFRADGSSVLGLGHLVRTSALAQELHRRGWDIHLATADLARLPRWVIDGFPGTHHDLGVVAAGAPIDQNEDCRRVRKLLERQDIRFDWVVVDHYGLDHAWHDGIRSLCTSVLALDDLADRMLGADVVLDPNRDPEAAEDAYRSLMVTGSSLIAGPKWALIRRSFLGKHPASSETSDPRILVLSGGTDVAGTTDYFLEALAGIDRKLAIDVIRGGAAAGASADTDTWDVVSRSMHEITVHVAPENPAMIMAGATLSLSTAGSTAWELACLGIPSLLLPIADNQHAILEQIVASAAGAGVRPASPDALGSKVGALLDLPDELEAMSLAGRRLVDGKGASRVADLMGGVESVS